MQKRFPGFYPLEDDRTEELISKATIVIDTEVLLDLFRLDKEDAKCYLSILEGVKDKLWIPYDVAWLYHKKLNEEILSQIENVNSVLSHLTQCKESILAAKKYPYIDPDLIKGLQSAANRIVVACSQERDYLTQNLKYGEIKDRIRLLFQATGEKDRIGKEYDKEQLASIYLSGEERYNNVVPPGYDSEKGAENRIYYHDLIIWKQILSYAKDECHRCQGIILVTGKIKRDWYYIVGDKIISTRHELVNEFMKEMNEKENDSKKFFYCLSSKQFIDMVSSKSRIVHPRLPHLKQQLREKIENASLNANCVLNNHTVNAGEL